MRALILIGIGILLLAELDKLIEILKPGVFIIVIILFIFILIGIGTTELIKLERKGWIGILNIFGVWSIILFFGIFLVWLFSLWFSLWFRSINLFYLSSILISGIIFALNVFMRYKDNNILTRYERTHLEKLREEPELDGNDAQIEETKLLIRDAEEALSNAFRQGINISQGTQKLLHYAQELLETHDLTDAREYALKCRENIESVIKEFEQQKTEQERELELERLRDETLNIIKSAKFLLEAAKKEFIPALQKEENLLANAQSFFDAKEYNDAKTVAQQCRNELERLSREYKDSLEQINAAKLSLEKVKKLGIPALQKEENLLANAQSFFDAKDYNDAKIAAQECQNELERLPGEYKDSLEEINAAKLSLEKVKKLGIPALQKEESLLTSIQSSFDAKKYSDAKIAAQQFQNELEVLMREYKDSLEEINLAKHYLEKAKKRGIPDMEKEERLLDDAQSSFNAKDYFNAKNAAQHFRDTANKLLEKSKPNILLNLPQRMQYNIWKFHDIIIKNNGTACAKNIILNFSKVFEIRELKNISQIDAGKQEILHINIKPTEAGDVPVDYTIKFSDSQDKTYEIKNSSTIQIGTLPDIKSPTEKNLLESEDLEITRGYVVLENKDLRFGILVKNISNYTVNDVDVHLKCDRSLFSLKDREVISLGNITKNNPKTATYFLTPLVGCVHYSKIRAIVSYKDASDNSLTVQMRPKEVHCISPFLAEKPMTEEQFSKLYESHSCHVDGIVFKGISADAITNFIVDSAKNKRYVVKNSFINGTHIIYLSSVAKDKTFYLITVIIRSKNGQTHVGLRACSNNEGGINNFINEILTSLRHYVTSDQSAREVENVINNISVQIINSEVHGGVSIGGDAFGRDESFNQGSKR